MSISREQIDQLAQILQDEFESTGNCTLEIQSHANPDCLTVFQEDRNAGTIHQLLISITYIGKQDIEKQNDRRQYNSFKDCKKSGKHLSDCDNDGFCSYCGHRD